VSLDIFGYGEIALCGLEVREIFTGGNCTATRNAEGRSYALCYSTQNTAVKPVNVAYGFYWPVQIEELQGN
jgi:hypothetical protein